MRSLTVLMFLLACPVFARAQNVPLDSAWIIKSFTPASPDGKQVFVTDISPVVNGSAIQFRFPVSNIADPHCGASIETPNVTVPGYGYSFRPWTASILGHSLTMTIAINVKSGNPVFNYIRESGNTCCYNAHVRFYIQTGSWSNPGPGPADAWWSNPDSIDLQRSLNQGLISITAPLDPAMWSNIIGENGLTNPGAFYNVLAHPSLVGVTFGGGCFFSHGISTYGGKVQFQLAGWGSQ